MRRSFFILSILLCSGCYNKIGTLTIVSTRNMDSKANYVLLSKDVRGTAHLRYNEALQTAIDRAVKQFPTGEFMENVIIEVSKNGRKVRVNGDVWGFPATLPTK